MTSNNGTKCPHFQPSWDSQCANIGIYEMKLWGVVSILLLLKLSCKFGILREIFLITFLQT